MRAFRIPRENQRRKVVGREPETKANSAEMLARNYMVQRIADLEAALSLIDPSHPLLDEVSTSLVA